MTISYTVSQGVAELVIDSPSINAPDGMHIAILDLLRRFADDTGAQVLLISYAEETFAASADVPELDRPAAEPGWAAVTRRLDTLPKPVIAALHGTVLGCALELALACHYRIAAADARFGFPEIKLGITPGAGGIQRTLRLAGPATAISLIAEGKTIGAQEAAAAGLIDEVAESANDGSSSSGASNGLGKSARDFAEHILANGRAARSAGDLPLLPDDPTLFEEARKKLARTMKGQVAPLAALDAIGLGYDHSFGAALDREDAIFRKLRSGAQARALQHNFRAERVVAHVPGIPEGATARAVVRAGVIGLGAMGRGIVMAIASAGVPVTAVAKDEAHRAAAEKTIANIWGSSVAKGSLSQGEMDKRLALIIWSIDPLDLGKVDLVIEAVSEDLAVKFATFAELGRVTTPGTILASNTSYLDIDALAAASGRAADVCGMHFFNPPHVMPLLENVRGQATDPQVIATIMAFGKTIAKLPILSGAGDGFIVNRMLAKRSREAYFLIEEGASPAAIDAAVTGFGFPMGPLALGDLAGLDVQAAARRARAVGATPRELRADFVEQMVAAGRLGQKNGAGWYRYDEHRKASANPDTDAMVAGHAAHHGLTLREIDEEEIKERLLYAIINEGAKILGEGVAPRSEEIDVAMIKGVGWPAITGGPMYWADRIGLDVVLTAIGRFRASQGAEYWTPAPLLVERATAGKGFYT